MRRDLAIAVLLVLAVLAAYGPLRHAEFVSYDDPLYITENPHVRVGLTGSGVGWAMTATDGSNWHPLTWLAHMADCQVFGLWAGGHHLVSVGLHAINAVLLFWLLRRMTAAVPARPSLGGGVWLSAFVAGLFALHPLHVESVAWISERKDVLSTFFGLLALLAYVRYAERPGVARYVPVFVLLAYGLMAKPMLVTLPFVMLLLDWWPLGRYPLRIANRELRIQTAPARDSFKFAIRNPQSAISFGRTSAPRLVLEKLPLFVLVAASCAVTYLVQQQGGAMKYAERLPFLTRLANVPVAYVTYLAHTVWPQGLAVFYPFVERPPWEVVLAVILLLAVTGAVVWQARRRPYLAVGWFWYLGMLLPVIGLVQVGQQAMADRYTYLPLIGIFIAVAWGAADLLCGRRYRAAVLAPVAAAVLVACTYVTTLQVRYWRDSESLLRHSVTVTGGGAMAYSNLGLALIEQGRREEALACFSKAISLDPQAEAGYDNFGITLYAQGHRDESIPYFVKALQINPRNGAAHNNLGLALLERGQVDEAITHFSEALRINPENAVALNSLGMAMARLGRLDEAETRYREALQVEPRYESVHMNLGRLLESRGRLDEAIAHYRAALRVDPRFVNAQESLGLALVSQGKTDEAIACLQNLAEMRPNYAEARVGLGTALCAAGRTNDGIASFRQALLINPGLATAHAHLGWTFAEQGKPAEGQAEYREALRLDPASVEAHYGLAMALIRQGDLVQGQAELREAVRLAPGWAEGLHRLARLLATAPDSRLRSADEAVALAERAVRLIGRRDPEVLDSLAAAYAEAGRFQDAARVAREAAALARSVGRPDLAGPIEARQKLYEAGQPWRTKP